MPRSRPAHVAEKGEVFDFELADAEMRDLFDVTGGVGGDLAGALGL